MIKEYRIKVDADNPVDHTVTELAVKALSGNLSNTFGIKAVVDFYIYEKLEPMAKGPVKPDIPDLEPEIDLELGEL
jgi:hypothetical protein